MDIPEHKTIQVELLIASLEPDDIVLKELLETAGERLIRTYSLIAAKGGEFAEKQKAMGKDVSRSYHDQSMLSHLLNGLFPVLNILKEVEANEIQKLDDFEKKLYVNSFILHDIDKTLGKRFDTSNDEGVSNLKDAVKSEMDNLNLNAFFPQYIEYLGDIAYIVVNTQERWGSNRFPPHFKTKLKERRLQLLTDLSTLSDLFASIFKSPSDVLSQEGQKICDRLKTISDHKLTLDYHKLADVRGALTNIINNALIKTYLDHGRKTLLFFPDGVVYLKEMSLTKVTLDLETIYTKVSSKMREIAKSRISRLIPVPVFSKDDDIRFPDLVYEVSSLESMLSLVVVVAYNTSASKPENAADISQKRLATLGSLQESDVIPIHLSLNFEGRAEITTVGRFLQTLEKKVLPYYFNQEEKEKILRDAAFRLAKEEGLEAVNTLSQIKNKTLSGGPAYKWFLVGAMFLKQNLGFDLDDVRKKLENIKDNILSQKKSFESNTDTDGLFFPLKEYLKNTVLFPILEDSGERDTLSDLSNFQKELRKYFISKSKGRLQGENKLLCILCNGTYEVKEPKETEVPFQNQAYRNRLRIGTPDPIGGICNICQIEFSLRQLLFNRRTQPEDKYFYIYPSYYFTTQTARFVEAVQKELKDFNFYYIHKQLCGRLNSVDPFIELERNIINPEKVEKHKKEITDNQYRKVEYPEDQIPTFIFFGFNGWGDTDTESWVYPALLALLSPYLFSSKVLATESPIPLFRSGSDFHESVFYDSIHPAYRFILKDTAIRLDSVEENLKRLLALFTMHYETFKDKWTLLNQEMREVATDPISVFSYFDQKIRQQDSKKLSGKVVQEIAQIYWDVFKVLGGEKMGLISETVDKYTKFYRAKGFSHYGMARPLRIASESVIKSSTTLPDEDIKLQIIGEIMEWLDRIRSGGAEGYMPKRVGGPTLIEAVKDFVDYFYGEVFKKYSEGDRALLKKKVNDFSSGCVAYYLMNYINWKEKETQEKGGEENVE